MAIKIEEDCLQGIQNDIRTQIVALTVIFIPIVGLSTDLRILLRMIEMREIENHTLAEIADIHRGLKPSCLGRRETFVPPSLVTKGCINLMQRY